MQFQQPQQRWILRRVRYALAAVAISCSSFFGSPPLNAAADTPTAESRWEEVSIEDDSPIDSYIAEGFEIAPVDLPSLPEGDQGWSATADPKQSVIPGQMRSDTEPVPAGFSKEDADLAETLEALNTADCQTFWPSPHQVCGETLAHYLTIGGPKSFLSYPASSEEETSDGVGRRTNFVNGAIYWHPLTGAHSTSGAFTAEWEKLGAEQSALGYPTGDEQNGRDASSRMQTFQNGELYASDHGIAAVHGEIRDRWNELGGADGELGLPIVSEQATPDGEGRYEVFERGVLYWSSDSGAVELTGSMLAQWAEDPEAKFAELGYPTAPMQQQSDGSFLQPFQLGTMYAASARPPWAACGIFSDKNKIIKTWEGKAGRHKGKKVTLKCGDWSGDKEGFRHIKKRHMNEWQRLAAWEQVSWMDVANKAITKSLTDPDIALKDSSTRRSSCYSGQIVLYNKVRGIPVATNEPSVIVGNTSRTIVTAFPGGKCKTH